MIASEIPLLPRVQVCPAAASIPVQSRCLGAMAHRQRLGTLQEYGQRRVRMGPSVSSLLGQWQGRDGQAVSHQQGSSAQQLSAGPLPTTDAWHTRLSS